MIICFIFVPQSLKTNLPVENGQQISEITLYADNAFCKTTSNITVRVETVFPFPSGTNLSDAMLNIAKCKNDVEDSVGGIQFQDCICGNLLWLLIPVIVSSFSILASVADLFTTAFSKDRDFYDSQQVYCASVFSFFVCVIWIAVSTAVTIFLTHK